MALKFVSVRVGKAAISANRTDKIIVFPEVFGIAKCHIESAVVENRKYVRYIPQRVLAQLPTYRRLRRFSRNANAAATR